MASSPDLWQKCARLIQIYPDRPPRLTADTELMRLQQELNSEAAEFANTLCPNQHWKANASVGLGNWAEVPWIAIFDVRESTSAQSGVYPVLHFSCDEVVGMRIGLGVSVSEFRDNLADKAKEVHAEFSDGDRNQLRRAQFIDVVAGTEERVTFGSGRRAVDYARGMIFERFVSLQDLQTSGDQLTDSLSVLLQVYKTWVDHKHPEMPKRPHFLEVMKQYADQRIVFLSPNRKARYSVATADDQICVVQQLDAEESVRVTSSGYYTKCQWLREQGGRALRQELDNTVAIHACYLQGPDLGLSSDKKVAVALDDDEAAIEHFSKLTETIQSPELYKPHILAIVIEAIASGELTSNRIEFDWLSPRFVDRLKQHGQQATEQQAAEGFVRLSNDLFWLLAHRDLKSEWSVDSPSPRKIRDRISHAVLKEPYWHALQNRRYQTCVLDALARKWWPEVTPIPTIENTAGLAAAAEQLITNIASTGYVYQPWQIAAYITALRTKPFVILAGVSGTGKSKLPMLVAEHTGSHRPRRVAVRPDWTDSSEVMGYVDLQDHFRAGVVLQELRAASDDDGRFHVCLVDEMNLARVEHYFAEFLSAIEDRKAADDGGYESSAILNLTLANDPDEWQSQHIPANLAIVGTVNMDETTHGFSRKVLDRAFTLELSEVNLRRLSKKDDRVLNTTSSPSWPLAYWHCRASRIEELGAASAEIHQDVQKAIETLEAINRLLRYSQLQVGYRTRDEVALFLVNARDVGSSFVTQEGDRVDPLDLALMMKILPRIVGGSNSIRRTLLALLGFAKDGKPLTMDDDPVEILRVWERDGRPSAYTGARFPRTTSRLCLMWERLEGEGYTSFWL